MIPEIPVAAAVRAESLGSRDIEPSKLWTYHGVFPRDKVAIMQQVGSEFGVYVEILVQKGEYTTRESLPRRDEDPKPFKPLTATLKEGQVFAKLSHTESIRDLSEFWRKVEELKKAAKPK